jgi:acyl-CoA reductase-like NAD-dependent aldehyde dehydrogenase
VPQSTAAEMQEAVDSAKKAFESWSQTSVLTRQQYLLKYQDSIKRNMVRGISAHPNNLLVSLNQSNL